jgi:hypothetical protein
MEMYVLWYSLRVPLLDGSMKCVYIIRLRAGLTKYTKRPIDGPPRRY